MIKTEHNITYLIDEYARFFKEAEQAAIAASKPEDGGTCNIDTVAVDFSGWRQKDIDRLVGKSGISIGDKITSKMWKGSRFVWFTMDGQASNRTRMVEAAAKVLRQYNVTANVFYKMD